MHPLDSMMAQDSLHDRTLHGRAVVHLFLMLLGVVAVHAFLYAFAGSRPPMQNVRWWQAIAGLMDAHGFFNVWTPYPPVFPTLFYAAHRVLPASSIGTAWQIFNIALVLGQAALVFAIGRKIVPGSPAASLKVSALAAFAYLVAMWQPRSAVLLGPWMDQFDYLPTLLLLLGLLLLLNGRDLPSAIVCGIGVMTKLFPGVLLLAALPYLGLKRGVRYAATALATCLIITTPFLIANSKAFTSTYRWSASRPAWESVWAYAFPAYDDREPLSNVPETLSPELAAGKFARPYDPRADRVEQYRAQTEKWDPANQVTVALQVVAMAAMALVMGRRRTPTGLCRGVLLLVLAFLFFSKGFSSYFLVWLAPLLCLVYPGAGGFGFSAALILLGNVELIGLRGQLAQIYGNPDAINYYTKLGPPGFLFWGAIFVRQGILAAIVAHQIHRLWNNREIRL